MPTRVTKDQAAPCGCRDASSRARAALWERDDSLSATRSSSIRKITLGGSASALLVAAVIATAFASTYGPAVFWGLAVTGCGALAASIVAVRRAGRGRDAMSRREA